MAEYVVNSRLSFAINFILAENTQFRSSPLLVAAKRWQKILTSVVGKSLADRKLNLARKLKKRLAF